jgi:hypothetical protein
MAGSKKGPIDPKKSPIELSFELDEEKIKQIRSCLRKGRLKVTVLDIEAIQAGRAQSAYEYD